MRAQDVILEYVGSFVPKSAEDLEDLQSFVEQEQEDIDSASIMVDDDEDKAAKLTKDYRALTAIDYVIKNNVRAFENPELLKSNIFLYDYEQDSGQVGAIHIQLHDDIAEVKWLGSYGTSGKKLLQAGLQVAKARGAKRVKLTAKWDSEGFYRKMGLQQGASKSDPFANSNMTDFTGDINEQKITEVNMSPGALKSFAASPVAQEMFMGFEAEMLISDLEQTDATAWEPDYSQDIPFPFDNNWYKVAADWLMSGDNPNTPQLVKRKLDDLQQGLMDFIEDKMQNYLASYAGRVALRRIIAKDRGADADEATVNRDIDTQNEYFDHAVDKIREHYYGATNYMPEFLDDERIHTMKDFCQVYNMSWPHYDKSYEGDLTFEDLESNFVDYTGYSATVSREYHGAKRGANVWIFEPDTSIDAEGDNAAGVELVSPPMPLADGLEALDRFWGWADQIGAYTNDSCGFHVGVSIKGKNKYDLDIVKLVLFLGDEYVLQRYKRLFNDYTVSSLRTIRNGLDQSWQNKQYDLDQAIGIVKKGVNKLAQSVMIQGMASTQKKHVSVNVREKYVEFRSAGGNYIERRDEIQNTILRYVRAMAIAADPEAEKQEYAKKLYKLFDRAKTPNENDTMNYFSQYIAGKITKSELKSRLYKVRKVTQPNPTVVDFADKKKASRTSI